MSSRALKLRRPDRCAGCSAELAVGTIARWDADARSVTCLRCFGVSAAVAKEPRAIDRGTPGASALREHDRRRRNREERTREAHPHIGGLLLALRNEPQHEVAFERGGRGEEAVAESLEQRTAGGPVVLLHDRRMPGGRGNIDHLAIAPTGVFVIDAKDWKGNVKVATPLFGKPRLLIAGRDCTKLVDGLNRQVAAVRATLTDTRPPWPIQGVLCFTLADLPLLGSTKMRSHLLLYRKALANRLNADGAFSPAEIDNTAHTLACAFPPA